MKFKIVLFLVLALVVSLLIFKNFITGHENKEYRYKLLNSWALPGELEEISGMIHLDNNRLLCIQDEDGYVFIYNLETKAIENAIKFGPGGDYESITKANDTIYVLRSDAQLFKIVDAFGDINVETFESEIDSKYNFEGLHYDARHNRLLMAPKYKLKRSSAKKPIFSFNLATQTFEASPFYQIHLNDSIFEAHPEFMPSSLVQHPEDKNFYMLDGRHRRLLILDSAFQPQNIYKLNISELPQPESLSFYGTKLYISSEADRGISQHIHEIELKP